MITVHVTADHITRGTPKDIYKCPVALALEDAGYEVAVDTATLTFERTGDWVRSPRAVERFIIVFDMDGAAAVQPFTFEIHGSFDDARTPESEVMGNNPILPHEGRK